MDMINLETFLKMNYIEFESEKKKLYWVKSLKPTHLVKIGKSYFVDQEELDRLFRAYLDDKVQLRRKRSTQAKNKFKRTKKTKPSV